MNQEIVTKMKFKFLEKIPKWFMLLIMIKLAIFQLLIEKDDILLERCVGKETTAITYKFLTPTGIYIQV